MEKIKEETYQRLKKELLEELDGRIFKDRVNNNKGLLQNMANEMVEKAELIANKKISRDKMVRLIDLNFNEIIREKVEEKLEKRIRIEMNKILKKKEKEFYNEILKKIEDFVGMNINSEMNCSFDKFKERNFESKMLEFAKEKLLDLVSISDLDGVLKARKEYREEAKKVKNEILRELQEDLYKIKRVKK